ncbi:MAG: ABC transporter ATP-binding protein [Taibaiella sp.]|jgi:ABC-type bacteriocin/lantibiotic exporter with double-glycine peptidase domain
MGCNFKATSSIPINHTLKKIIQRTIASLNNKERKQLSRLTLFQALISIADIGSLILLLALIQLYTETSQTSHESSLYVTGRYLMDIHYLFPILLFLVLFLLKNALAYLAVKMQYHYVYRVASRISLSNMRNYLNGSYTDYVQTDASVSMHRISNLPVQFCHYLLAGLQQMFTEFTVTTVAILAILIFNAKLFLLLLAIIIPPLLIAAYVTRRKLKTARLQVKDNAEKSTQYLQEALQGYIESNIFNKKGFFTNRYAVHQQRLNNYLAQLQISQALPSRFVEIFAVAGLLILIMVNKYADHTTTEIVNIGAFMAAAYKIIPGITRIAALTAQMRTYAFTLNDISADTDTTIEPYNHIHEKIASIEFKDVSFSYKDNEILNCFNMQVQAGDLLGISSASGKGKTTLINILLGFLKPDSGQVLINEVMLGADERKQYWQDITYVKQQHFLIHDTILHNITLEEEHYDEARFNKAIAAAGLEMFINSFPEGINKVISDNGKNISGGQRQRIALARALYRDTAVIMLDEPFSELDQDSEHSILQYLQSLAAAGKIVILITHNLASLQYCTKTISVNA